MVFIPKRTRQEETLLAQAAAFSKQSAGEFFDNLSSVVDGNVLKFMLSR